MKRHLFAIALVTLQVGLSIVRGDAASPPRPTSVAVNFAVADDMQYNIRSDGAGTYSNGSSGVAANFNSSGNLQIDFGARTLYYQYTQALPSVAGVDPDPATPPDLSAVGGKPPGSHMSTAPGAAGQPLIQNMIVGSSQCVRVFVAYDLDGTTYRNNFEWAGGGNSVVGTAWGLITHVDANTWTLDTGACGDTPEGPGAARVYEPYTIKGKSYVRSHGVFDLPFHMTLTRA